MKDIGSGFAHLSPVGIGVQSVLTNHHLSLGLIKGKPLEG